MTEFSRFMAWVGIVAGVLIAGLGGLCTFTVMTASDGGVLGPLPLVVGAVPVAFGGWIAFLGILALREGRSGD